MPRTSHDLLNGAQKVKIRLENNNVFLAYKENIRLKLSYLPTASLDQSQPVQAISCNGPDDGVSTAKTRNAIEPDVIALNEVHIKYDLS